MPDPFPPFQVSSKKSLSLKELSEEPDSVSLVRVRAALGEERPLISCCGWRGPAWSPWWV